MKGGIEGTRQKVAGRRRSKTGGPLAEEEMVFLVDTAKFQPWIQADTVKGQLNALPFEITPYQAGLLQDFAKAAGLGR